MNRVLTIALLSCFTSLSQPAVPASAADPIRDLQTQAMKQKSAPWGHWGIDPSKYNQWTNHSNRLIPVYTFGIDLNQLRKSGSVYQDAAAIKELYGDVPKETLRDEAAYFDQTDILRLQWQAIEQGRRNIILLVFDGMDWQTTHAAATAAGGKVAYTQGRGTGLSFLDYRGAKTDYGYFVTSSHHGKAKFDVDAQTVIDGRQGNGGGYSPERGGATPWAKANSRDYLIGLDRDCPHVVTDSASSATSLCSGIKTYNAAINVTVDGEKVEPIGRILQRERKFSVGVVSSVPISHATPASAYANNVSRSDYQDITRDLLGLASSSNRQPLPGADVVIGAGWGKDKKSASAQGTNFQPGNQYALIEDLQASDIQHGGRYEVAIRRAGQHGARALQQAARRAARNGHRLLGYFGTQYDHLPFRTADGAFNPTDDVKGQETYSPADIHENPTLAEMTEAALSVLETNPRGFWLMVEAGDVDWANHANNIDNSIGAVISGAEAFSAIVDWVEQNDAWDDTALIVTADHGHHLLVTDPTVLTGDAKSDVKSDVNSKGDQK